MRTNLKVRHYYRSDEELGKLLLSIKRVNNVAKSCATRMVIKFPGYQYQSNVAPFEGPEGVLKVMEPSSRASGVS